MKNFNITSPNTGNDFPDAILTVLYFEFFNGVLTTFSSDIISLYRDSGIALEHAPVSIKERRLVMELNFRGT